MSILEITIVRNSERYQVTRGDVNSASMNVNANGANSHLKQQAPVRVVKNRDGIFIGEEQRCVPLLGIVSYGGASELNRFLVVAGEAPKP
jgi:hypothetical protein